MCCKQVDLLIILVSTFLSAITSLKSVNTEHQDASITIETQIEYSSVN